MRYQRSSMRAHGPPMWPGSMAMRRSARGLAGLESGGSSEALRQKRDSGFGREAEEAAKRSE